MSSDDELWEPPLSEYVDALGRALDHLRSVWDYEAETHPQHVQPEQPETNDSPRPSRRIAHKEMA